MQANVGGFDRIARIVLGIALILFALLSTSEYRWWGLIGIVPLFTGIVRWCPLYAPFGIKTCRTP
jgi:sulfite exporter TauE/SafE